MLTGTNITVILNTVMSKTTIECESCGSKNAYVILDPKYHGFRGICPECGSNWPES